MKKTLLLNLNTTFLFSLGINSVGCSVPTALDRMRVNIDFINANGGELFLYKNYIEILSDELNISTIKSLTEINFESNFIMIIIMFEQYDAMTKDFVQKLFWEILRRDENIMVVFVDFLDLNFLEYIDEDNTDLNNPSYIESFDNFFGYTNRVSSVDDSDVTVTGGPIVIFTTEERLVWWFAHSILQYNIIN